MGTHLALWLSLLVPGTPVAPGHGVSSAVPAAGAIMEAARIQDPAGGEARDAEALRLLRACDGALGGAAVRERRGHLRLEGTCSIAGFEARGAVVDRLAPDGRVHLSTDFEGLGTFSLGFDGLVCWELAPGTVDLRRGWAADAARRRHAWSRLAPPLERYRGLRVVGEETRGEVACWKLECVPEARSEPGHRPAPDLVWLDRETHLPVRVELDSQLTTGQPGRVAVEFEDWRDLEGAPFAHRRRLTVGGPALVFEYPRVFVREEVTGSTYALGPELCDAIRERLASPGRPDFHLERRAPVTVAVVEARRAGAGDPAAEGAQLVELWSALRADLAERDTGVTGPPVFRRLRRDGEAWLEAGLPVARAPGGEGAPATRGLPGGWVLSGTHVGGLATLERTESTRDTWFLGLPTGDGRTLERAGDPWFALVGDPADGAPPDPGTARIELVAPVRPE